MCYSKQEHHWRWCHLMAGSRGRRAIQALMLEATQSHVVADDVQNSHHLTEDQHPAATRPLTAETPQR